MIVLLEQCKQCHSGHNKGEMSESQEYVQQRACYIELAPLVQKTEHPFLLRPDPEQKVETKKDWVVSLLLSLKMGMSGPPWSIGFCDRPSRLRF